MNPVRYGYFTRQMQAFAAPGKTVLDVGCGGGFLTEPPRGRPQCCRHRSIRQLHSRGTRTRCAQPVNDRLPGRERRVPAVPGQFVRYCQLLRRLGTCSRCESGDPGDLTDAKDRRRVPLRHRQSNRDELDPTDQALESTGTSQASAKPERACVAEVHLARRTLCRTTRKAQLSPQNWKGILLGPEEIRRSCCIRCGEFATGGWGDRRLRSSSRCTRLMISVSLTLAGL